MQLKITFRFFTFCFLILYGCNEKLNEALNSNDAAYILSQGNNFFSQKKYSEALQLYERATPMLQGTKAIKNLIYNTAMANFYNKNYDLAAHQFKNFYSIYPSDKQAEEALFNSAYSYYMSSPNYNLDQSKTHIALEELKNFINQYPESKKNLKVNVFIQTLNNKLEKKYFEIAKIYHHIMYYKAAVKAFEQFINDFQKSPLKEKARYYKLDAQYELATHSDPLLEKERLKELLNMIKSFIKLYPNSYYKEEITKIKKKSLQNLKNVKKFSTIKNDIIN